MQISSVIAVLHSEIKRTSGQMAALFRTQYMHLAAEFIYLCCKPKFVKVSYCFVTFVTF